MKLYLRCQVEKFSFEKWGGAEGLDAEYERRIKEKSDRKDLAFTKKINDLRKRTRIESWKEKLEKKAEGGGEGKHEHVLVDADSECLQVCEICGVEVEVDEF
jgi:DNA-repair protein complementing XP-A cells